MTLDEFLKLPGAKAHGGGQCPVDILGRAELLSRDGYTATVGAGMKLWEHGSYGHPDADIVAYRIIGP